jgi:hypothetical protein
MHLEQEFITVPHWSLSPQEMPSEAMGGDNEEDEALPPLFLLDPSIPWVQLSPLLWFGSHKVMWKQRSRIKSTLKEMGRRSRKRHKTRRQRRNGRKESGILVVWLLSSLTKKPGMHGMPLVYLILQTIPTLLVPCLLNMRRFQQKIPTLSTPPPLNVRRFQKMLRNIPLPPPSGPESSSCSVPVPLSQSSTD